MDDETRDFIRSNHRAVMATRRSDGGVQMSPVTEALDSDDTLLVSTREPTAKVRNLHRHPYAWLTILNDRFFGQWMQVEGPVTIVGLPEAMEGLVHYYRIAAGEHPNWDEYREAMRRDQRVLVRMRIERITPRPRD